MGDMTLMRNLGVLTVAEWSGDALGSLPANSVPSAHFKAASRFCAAAVQKTLPTQDNSLLKHTDRQPACV
jgi:hypothetical protein